MSHEVNFPDYLWRLAQQQSGLRNPAPWIRNRIGELLTRGAVERYQRDPDPIPADDPLGAFGIYAKTDRANLINYANSETDGDVELAIKALASKDNPTAFLQWWADKQTNEPASKPAPERRPDSGAT